MFAPRRGNGIATPTRMHRPLRHRHRARHGRREAGDPARRL